MKGWVGLVGWPMADGLRTLVVTHQLQFERRTGKVRRPETDILPLCHATNCHVVRWTEWCHVWFCLLWFVLTAIRCDTSECLGDFFAVISCRGLCLYQSARHISWALANWLVLPFWYWLTWVVPDKGPLNGCVCVCVANWLIIKHIYLTD